MSDRFPFLFLIMASCYILSSEKLKRFYVGATQDDLSERIRKHNAHTYGNHRYTAKADDWELFLEIECPSYSLAVCIERHIKKMKSREFINNLKRYPELVERLKEQYKQ